MFLSIVSVAAMALTAVYMVLHAKGEEARRLVWVPIAACGVELLAMGVLTPSLFPVLTAVLIGLRLCLLGICGVAMRRDAAAARARRRRRERLARELHAALHPLHEVPTGFTHTQSARQVHIA